VAEPDIRSRIQHRVLRLNAVAQGVSIGSILALLVFAATNWLVLKGGEVVGPHLSLLSQYMIGYQVSFVGSLVGAAYAFLFGLLAGVFVAEIYNRVADWREARRADAD